MSYQCLLCNRENFSLLYEKGRHGKRVNNYVCDHCGFVFILPRPDFGQMQELYEGGKFSKEARNLNRPDNAKFEQSEKSAQVRFDSLQKVLSDKVWDTQNFDNHVLEVGCGTGSFLRLMRGAGWQASGLEPDACYAQAVIDRYNLSIESQTLEQYKPNGKFDLVASFHVIEHVPDPNAFLEKIHSSLKDDGFIYLECPSIDKWYGDEIDFFFWDVHINTFSGITLNSFLVKNRFRPLKSGWHGNGLWIIAQKSEVQVQSVPLDSSSRIKSIVQLAQTNKRRTGIKTIIKKIGSKSKRRIKSAVKKDLGYPEDAEKVAVKPIGLRSANLRIAHVGLHMNGNAGDTLLFPAIRWLFQKYLGNIRFELLPLRDKVTEETIEIINKQDALLIGGGGLFLADSNPNNLSGWQWACPVELLEKIRVPIIVFAVGYNRFRGQSEFSPVFTESIQKLVEKSIFVGLRNRGSIAALQKYLPYELHSKLTFQPCATSVMEKFYPGVKDHTKDLEKVIAVNIAFDRQHLRFGQNEDAILWNIADALAELKAKGWLPKLFIHTPKDVEAHYWFKARGLDLDHVNLAGVAPDLIIKEYRKASLAMGMRGHAQMIPFGVNRPIYSLISHDKLRFFLEDISHPEWGIEVQDLDLRNKLVSDISNIGQNIDKIESEVSDAQNELWETTINNLETIKRELIS